MSRKIVPSKLNGDLMGELAPKICAENNRERALDLIRTILPSAIYEGTRDYLYAEFVTNPDRSLPINTSLIRHDSRVASVFIDERKASTTKGIIVRYSCPETNQDLETDIANVSCARFYADDEEKATYAIDCDCGFMHVVNTGEIVLEAYAQADVNLAKAAYPATPLVLGHDNYTGPEQPITYQELIKVRNLTPAELSVIASGL